MTTVGGLSTGLESPNGKHTHPTATAATGYLRRLLALSQQQLQQAAIQQDWMDLLSRKQQLLQVLADMDLASLLRNGDRATGQLTREIIETEQATIRLLAEILRCERSAQEMLVRQLSVLRTSLASHQSAAAQ
jgi:hypothetical protein